MIVKRPPKTTHRCSFLCSETNESLLSLSLYGSRGMKLEEMGGGDDGGGRVGGREDEMGNGIVQCSDHPFMVNHGGVCAFCLQEKLGKLVSSSLSLPLRCSTSSSSSPSFRSDYGGAAPSASSLSLSIRPTPSKTVNGGGASGSVYRCDEYYNSGRAWIPFLTAKKKKKKNGPDVVFKRSKSTSAYTTPRKNRYSDSINDGGDLSRRDRGGFWSFLSLASSYRQSSKRTDRSSRENSKIVSMAEPTLTVGSMGKDGTIVEEDDSLDSSIDRKVSRSRSVGCGSRSFSGDIFERISTGFGDCTLRRVESQRESKPKARQDRVKCGGLFGGFMVTSSSSSSSSSSYWVSSDNSNGSKPASVSIPPPHRRSKSWNWAFASPMRAFSKATSSKDLKMVTLREHSDKNAGSNSAAIPPLMAVRS